MSYSRFAIYDVPPKGALAGAGAAWLGWDVAAARDIADAMGVSLCDGGVQYSPDPHRAIARRNDPYVGGEGKEPAARIARALCS